MAEEDLDQQKLMDIDEEENEGPVSEGVNNDADEVDQLGMDFANRLYIENIILATYLGLRLAEAGNPISEPSESESSESSESLESEFYSSDSDDEVLPAVCPKKMKPNRRSKDAALKTIKEKSSFEEYYVSEESDEDPSYIPPPSKKSNCDKTAIESSKGESSKGESSGKDESEDDDSPMKPAKD